MTRRSARAARWSMLLVSAVLVGCGPTILDVLEDTEGTSTGPGDRETTSTITLTSPVTTMVTTSPPPPPPPPGTTLPPPIDTTGPGETDGPLDTGPVNFIPRWDAPPSECTIGADDCPPGLKCAPHSNGGDFDTTHCVPIAPDPAGLGEPCVNTGAIGEGFDDCDAGLLCFPADAETDEGTCSIVCGAGEQLFELCPPTDYCAQFTNGVAVCLLLCDPLLQDCPDLDDGCYWSPTEEVALCAPTVLASDGQIGDTCSFVNACAPGLHCAAAADVPGCAGGSGCCSPYCDPAGPDGCDTVLMGTTCSELAPMAGIGVCSL